MFINRMQTTVTSSYFHPHFVCPLCWLLSTNYGWWKFISQLKSDHWHFVWYLYFSISEKKVQNTDKYSKFGALDLNCWFTEFGTPAVYCWLWPQRWRSGISWSLQLSCNIMSSTHVMSVWTRSFLVFHSMASLAVFRLKGLKNRLTHAHASDALICAFSHYVCWTVRTLWWNVNIVRLTTGRAWPTQLTHVEPTRETGELSPLLQALYY